MVGPTVNAGAVVLGCFSGFLVGKHLPDRIKKNMPLIFGCASMTLGISMISQIKQIPAVILALLIGSFLGELINFQAVLERFSKLLFVKLSKSGPSYHGMTFENFTTLFSSILVIFCFSGTGVVGALNEGLTGDPSLLIVKSCLDFLTAMIFTANIGFGLLLFVLPMFAVQSSLYLGANSINIYLTPTIIGDFKAAGGILMLAAGFNLMELKSFRLLNMLPSVFLVLVISALWSYFVH